MDEKVNKISQWLLQFMEQNNMSQADVARAVGVTRSTINGLINGGKRAGPGLCITLAKVFQVKPEEVFKAAGILPEITTVSMPDRMNYLVSLLPKEDQQDILDFIDMKIRQREKKHGRGKTPGNLQENMEQIDND